MTRKHSSWRNLFGRRVRRTVLAMGLAVVATVATAGAAAATGKTCKEVRNQYVICLEITSDWDSPYSNHFKVKVGIDVYMNQHDARNIVDDGGVFSAVAWGSDPLSDDYLQGIGRTSVWVFDRGVSAEFEESISGGELDEDFAQDDEVFARVSLFLAATGETRTFRSNNFVDNFHG